MANCCRPGAYQGLPKICLGYHQTLQGDWVTLNQAQIGPKKDTPDERLGREDQGHDRQEQREVDTADDQEVQRQRLHGLESGQN